MKLHGVLHGEYWVNGKCVETFDTPIVATDEGVDAVLDITFRTHIQSEKDFYIGIYS